MPVNWQISGSPSAPLPLVGREAELAFLHATLLREGGGSVLLDGAEGSGKSRLVQELMEEARRAGYLVLGAQCHDSGFPVTLLPLLEMLSKAGARGSDWIEGLIEQMGPPMASAYATGQRDPRLRFFREIAAGLRDIAAEGPLLLVVEDLQWADADSLVFFCHLLDVAGGRVPLLLTRRPEQSDRGALFYDLEARCRRLELHPLDDASIGTILQTILGPLTAQETRDLVRAAEGSPMLAVEIARHIRASGLFERLPLAEVLRAGFPRRVRDLLQSRVDQLTESGRAVLEAAACLGQLFEAERVAAAAAIAPAAATDELVAAERLGLLAHDEFTPRGHWRFTSHLLREFLYEQQAPSRRRQTHARIGVLRGLPLEELALHRALGFEDERRSEALASCREAAAHLERVGAYEAAASMWGHALECTDASDTAQRAELLALIGHAHRAASSWTFAIAAMEEAFALQESLNDRQGAAQTALTIGEMCRFRLQLADAVEWLERARERLEDSPETEAVCCALLGSAFIAMDRPEQGMALIGEALDLSERAGRLRPVVAYWSSYAFSIDGDPDAAARMAERGIESADGLDQPYVSLLHGALAQTQLARLESAAAEDHVRILEASEEADPVARVRTLLCRTLLESLHGNWAAVISECERWSAEVRRAGKFQVATARVIWAEAASALGNHQDAADALAEAMPDLESMRPLAGLHLARVLLRLGQVEAARELANQHAMQIMSAARSPFGRFVLGDLVGLLDDPETIERLYRGLAQERRLVTAVYAPTSVDRIRGKVAAALGRYYEAFHHFDSAIADLTRAGARWELAMAHLDYADARRQRAKRGDASRAAALEMRALALLQAMGAPAPARAAVVERHTERQFGLSVRELEVLKLIASGRRNEEIAADLMVSKRTVHGHVSNILQKMNVQSRTQAVVEAVSAGLLIEDEGRGVQPK